jgi:cytochrome c oxidase subunit 4
MPEHTEHSEHIVPVWIYLLIFATLFVLTIVTAWVSFKDLSTNIHGHVINFNPLVALTIAVFKASLVVLFFMHVKYSPRLTKTVVGVGIFFLLILLSLTMTDYLSRGLMTSPTSSHMNTTVPAQK